MTDDVPTFSPSKPAPPARPFKLAGRTLTADEPWEETFSILGQIPQGPIVDLAAAVTIEKGELRYNAAAVVRFLRASVVPGDEQRFEALLNDKDRPMELEQLGGVMLWAAGIATERPTGPLSSSTTGQRDTEPGSEDVPSTPDDPQDGSPS